MRLSPAPLLTLGSLAAALVLAGAAVPGFAAAALAAAAAQTAITCTNPASGTTWQINVDYEKNTVDTYAASISDSQISWHDAKEGGTYTLDRHSGNLTFVAPSSTGGYFIFDRCNLDHAG